MNSIQDLSRNVSNIQDNPAKWMRKMVIRSKKLISIKYISNLVKGEEESHYILIQRPIHQKDMKW